MMISNKYIHFIGIGGAGMLPLALHCQKLGFKITGSDLSDEAFAQLIEQGISPVKGHDQLPVGTEIVVYSSAVRADNQEFQQATQRELPIYKRADFLGLLTKESQAILICGCHGKSTTSVMLADVLYRHPNFLASGIIGAQANSIDSNYYSGSQDYFVVEADEYDRSFLKMFPHDIAMLNIDDDHLDIYGDMAGLVSAFTEFAQRMHPDGVLAYNADDERVNAIAAELTCKRVSFGLKKNANYSATKTKYHNFRTTAELLIDNVPVGLITYLYTGKHNLYNMLAAFAICTEKGIQPAEFIEHMQSFQGLKRRQELIYSGDFWLMDDYAHHSTEVKSSLSAIRESFEGRIIALFQPHLYSRTKHQYKEFAKSFTDADLVYISHIYPARELFDGSITSDMIKSEMDESSANKTTVFTCFDNLYDELKKSIKPGDLVISLGAGEINKLIYRLKAELVEEI